LNDGGDKMPTVAIAAQKSVRKRQSGPAPALGIHHEHFALMNSEARCRVDIHLTEGDEHGPRYAAMGDNDRPGPEFGEEGGDPFDQHPVALAAMARWAVTPAHPVALGGGGRIATPDFRPGRTLPGPEADLPKAMIGAVLVRRQPQRRTHDLHRAPGAQEWAGDEVEVCQISSRGRGEAWSHSRRLRLAHRIQVDVTASLEASLGIPAGLPVTNEIDGPQTLLPRPTGGTRNGREARPFRYRTAMPPTGQNRMSKKHGKHKSGQIAGAPEVSDRGRLSHGHARPPSTALWAHAGDEIASLMPGALGAAPRSQAVPASGIVVAPGGARFDLAAIDTKPNPEFDKDWAEEALRRERVRLAELQERLYGERTRSLLIVFQAIDTGGKDGTIRSVLKGVNPQGCTVASFKVPSADELEHDFLWRYHARTPARGMIGVFNRSHYEDVLVVRVKGLVPDEVWRTRYGLINDFERMLTESGTTILKFFLHISKAEQKERLDALRPLARGPRRPEMASQLPRREDRGRHAGGDGPTLPGRPEGSRQPDRAGLGGAGRAQSTSDA